MTNDQIAYTQTLIQIELWSTGHLRMFVGRGGSTRAVRAAAKRYNPVYDHQQWEVFDAN